MNPTPSSKTRLKNHGSADSALYARSGTSPGTGGPFGAALVPVVGVVLRSVDGR